MGSTPLLNILGSRDLSQYLFTALDNTDLVILSRTSKPVKSLLLLELSDRREDWLDSLPQDHLTTRFYRAFPNLIR